MAPFTKIDLDISFTAQSRKGEPTVSYGPIHYYRVLGRPFRFDLLQKWKPSSVLWVEITGPALALPHRDKGIITSLNCYFEAADTTTHFWTPKADIQRAVYEGDPHPYLYNFKDLTHTGSFKAVDGDCYLLDVSKIHSVMKKPETVRRFIQLSWNTTPYEEVLSLIQSTQ